MEFFNPKSNVNFMGIRRYTVAVAVLLVVISIVSLSTKGLNLALDFTGGTLTEVSYSDAVEQSVVSEALTKAGMHGAQVQRFNSKSFSVRLSPETVEKITAGSGSVAESSLDDNNARVAEALTQALQADGHSVTLKPSEFVGPQVGAELAYNGIVAVLVVLTGIVIYVAMRFEWKFGVAAIAGEIHDVVVTLGFFSLFGLDFDLTVLAAILAVDGYSVNDKIVVFDRVRELFRSSRKASPEDILNLAVNETLSRTIMTSLTTLLTVVALYLFGGESLQGFALALIVGIIVGTLSSIFFASPILLALGVSKQDLMPKARDEAELAKRP